MRNGIPYVGLFLVLGAAVGGFVFGLTRQAWHIGAGAGIGIVISAMVQSIVGRGKR